MKCDRLFSFTEKIAREKRRSYMNWDYWGKAVPGYGDPNAKIMILGLAPAAHGGNRSAASCIMAASRASRGSTRFSTGHAAARNDPRSVGRCAPHRR